MLDFTKHYATRPARLVTPQGERIPGTTQVPNSAGGYAWAVDPWTRFDRFLIFGSERGTYYIRERTLTVENATNARLVIAEDGQRAVRRIVQISTGGRAPSNDPALFALAMCAGLGTHRWAVDTFVVFTDSETGPGTFIRRRRFATIGSTWRLRPSWWWSR